VCGKPRSSCWSFHLLREEFLSAPIHSPLLWFAVSVLQFGLQSLVEVSFCSFLFFLFSLLLLYVGVVNALIKGKIEDHVWFEDWWMVASLCDE
jgi:hypothetical protein